MRPQLGVGGGEGYPPNFPVSGGLVARLPSLRDHRSVHQRYWNGQSSDPHSVCVYRFRVSERPAESLPVSSATPNPSRSLSRRSLARESREQIVAIGPSDTGPHSVTNRSIIPFYRGTRPSVDRSSGAEGAIEAGPVGSGVNSKCGPGLSTGGQEPPPRRHVDADGHPGVVTVAPKPVFAGMCVGGGRAGEQVPPGGRDGGDHRGAVRGCVGG